MAVTIPKIYLYGQTCLESQTSEPKTPHYKIKKVIVIN